MKKNKFKKFHIKDPVYGQHFYLIVNCDIAKSKKEMSNITKCNCCEPEINEAAGMHHFWTCDHGSWVFIWIEHFEWLIKDQKYLVHELFHHVSRTLEYCGLNLCDGSEEAYAYYMGYVFEQCYKKLKSLHPKNERKTRKTK